MKTLVLGLGNDLIADDAVGLDAAQALAPMLEGIAEVRRTSVHGIALLDDMLGYDRVILLDACRSGKHPPGTIVELSPADLSPVVAPSPHYAGLPEMFALASQLGLRFPEDVQILAVETRDLETVGGPMTPAVRAAIPLLCAKVMRLLEGVACNQEAVCTHG